MLKGCCVWKCNMHAAAWLSVCVCCAVLCFSVPYTHPSPLLSVKPHAPHGRGKAKNDRDVICVGNRGRSPAERTLAIISGAKWQTGARRGNMPVTSHHITYIQRIHTSSRV